MYLIMKIMCLPGYHHNGFVATHALGHMSTLCVVDHLYIYIYIYTTDIIDLLFLLLLVIY